MRSWTMTFAQIAKGQEDYELAFVWTTDCQVEHLGWHFLWWCLGLSPKQQQIISEVPNLKVDRFHQSHQGLLSQLMWLHTHVLPMPHRQVTWSTHDTLHGNGTKNHLWSGLNSWPIPTVTHDDHTSKKRQLSQCTTKGFSSTWPLETAQAADGATKHNTPEVASSI